MKPKDKDFVEIHYISYNLYKIIWKNDNNLVEFVEFYINRKLLQLYS